MEGLQAKSSQTETNMSLTSSHACLSYVPHIITCLSVLCPSHRHMLVCLMSLTSSHACLSYVLSHRHMLVCLMSSHIITCLSVLCPSHRHMLVCHMSSHMSCHMSSHMSCHMPCHMPSRYICLTSTSGSSPLLMARVRGVFPLPSVW